MLKFLRDLDGHSGCIISLYQNDNLDIFIRKKSFSFEYNRRLKIQFIKQKKYNINKAKTPYILGCGYENNLFYFDMEYVPSKTFAEYINIIKIPDLIDYIRLLFNSLDIKKSIKDSNVARIFRKKIYELSLQIPNKSLIFTNAFKLLNTTNWEFVSKSNCHGDLTLENILISSDNKLFLIDFLDSFYNSWMIDMAKIFQDIECGWSFRNMKNDTNRELRLLIAKETLTEMILTLNNGVEILSSVYNILLLNLLRIVPYTKDKNTLDFLNNSILKITNIIEKRRKI